MNKLNKFKKKRVTLEELLSAEISEQEILSFVTEGKLVPMKSSGTNGNLRNPLYKKYSIVTEKEDHSATISEIKKLHPKLVANGYLLRKPEAFEKNQAELTAISRFLQDNSEKCYISRRERSFQLFGEEKYLDNNISLMQSIGLTENDLKFYTTPEQCFSDYIPQRKENMTLLICENKDIWFNIRRLMAEESYSEFFGVHIDGVIYGQGNDVTGKGKFSSYARFLNSGKLSLLYCGDIDRAGFDIFYRLCKEATEFNIELFAPIYKKMLELADVSSLPESDDKRGKDIETDGLHELFSDEEIDKINDVLSSDKRLPQEIINYEVLKNNSR